MGFRARWIAVKMQGDVEVLNRLDLVDTGTRDSELNDVGFGAVQSGDWFIILASGWDHMDALTEEHARRLSADTETLFCYSDDTPMANRMVRFSQGRSKWEIDYTCQAGFDFVGCPPKAFTSIAAEQRRK